MCVQKQLVAVLQFTELNARSTLKKSCQERKLSANKHVTSGILREAKMVEQETGIMIEQSKKAGKELCQISC